MKKLFWTGTILAILGFATISVLAQNQTKTIRGESGLLFGAQVTSWVKLNAQKVVEVGMTLSLKSIENAPLPATNDANNMAGMSMGPTLRLELPSVVKDTTFLDHIDLYWEAFGHSPARFITPHFDIHFFGISSANTDKIDCKNLTPPDLKLTPAGFAPAVPPGVDPATMCVPNMGFHGLSLAEFTSPGQLKPGLFDYTVVTGFYDNKFIFTEPMISKAFLLKKQSFGSVISRPAIVGRNTLYPTEFNLRFDSQKNAFQLIYSNFEMGQ